MSSPSATNYRRNSQLRVGSGKKLTANGKLNFPHSIVFDPHDHHRQSSQPPKQEEEKQQQGSKNGCIIVSDSNHRLQWFDRLSLRHLTSYGRKGTELGQFNDPTGLCLQPITNRLVVCDAGNNRVQVLSLDDVVPLPLFALGRTPISDANGNVEGSEKKGEFNQPRGMCCSPNGGIFIADTWNHRVQSFDAAGRFLSTFGSLGFGNQEFRFPSDACLVHPYFSPSSLASGMLCVSDFMNRRFSAWSSKLNQRVSVWNYNIPFSTSSPQHLFNFGVAGQARGLCVDLKGYLHVSCSGPSQVVQIFDFRMVRSTNSCTVRSTNFTRSTNPALIQTLGKDGGQGGEGSGPGEFYEPTGMCVDNENVLMVVDKGNHRLQFFEECQH